MPYNCAKLLKYRTDTIYTPARPQELRQDTTWADDILGLGANNPLAYRRSLAAEVDAYLLDSQVGTSILNFWQVSSLFFCYVQSDIRHRKISFGIPQFLPLQWTFFLFKVQQYHVREFSPQEKRPQLHDVIALALSLWRLCKCSNLQYAKAGV